MLTFLIYTLIIIGFITRSGEVLILALPLIIYVAASYVYTPKKMALVLQRHLSANRVSPDKSVTITLTAHNQGQTLEQLEILDHIPPGLNLDDSTAQILTTLEPDEKIDLTYTVSGARGQYYFSPVTITTSDYLGRFKKVETLHAHGQLFILPEVIKLKRADIRPRRTRVYTGQIPTRQGGPGVEFYGLREYEPGDEMRWVNAKATARHTQKIFVNQYEQERAADIGLVLDVRQQSDIQSKEHSLFEYGVQATAALADTLLTQGNRVGMLIYGDALDWTYPRYGKQQRERILHALAKAQQSARPIFSDLSRIPAQLFPIRSQLIFISPLNPKDAEALLQLRAREYSIVVISPDPIEFESRLMPLDKESNRAFELANRLARLERKLLLQQLQQAGIRVVEWDVSTPFQHVAHLALERATFQS